MKAVINEKGELAIDMSELIEALPDESKRTIAKYAVFQDVLLEGVVDALVTGQMWSNDEDGPWWHGGDTFTRLRLKLLPLLPKMTVEVIRHLERQLRQAKHDERLHHDAAWKLWHAWPDGPRPESPGQWRADTDYQRTMTTEEAEKYLRDVEQRIAAEKPEIERLRDLLRTACQHGYRLAGLECSSEDEHRFVELAKQAGIEEREVNPDLAQAEEFTRG